MALLKQITGILEEETALKLVAQTYGELALTKLQRIRSTIEKNRDFVREVGQTYYLIKAMSAVEGKTPKNKKGTISLLLTSNNHFYGDLENQLIKLYASHTPEFETDRVVVGQTAAEYLRAVGYRYPFEEKVFRSDLPENQELAGMVDRIQNYERVFVYHSRMQSILVQQPTFTDLTGSPAFTQELANQVFYYIFEPEVTKMLEFIERQIVALLLEQTFLEAELARTAARLVAMQEAQNNAGKEITKQKKLLAQIRRRVFNNRLLEITLNRKAREQNEFAVTQ